MIRFNSILWRIVLLHGLAVAAVAVLLPGIVAQRLHATAEVYQRRLLGDRLAVIAHTVAWTPSGELTLPSGVAETINGDGSFGFLVTDPQGRRLLGTSGAPARLSSPPGPDETYFQARLGAHAYAGLEAAAKVGGRPVVIEVVQNLDHPDVVMDDVEAVFLSNLAWLILPVLAALFALDLLVVRAVLQPVRKASLEARKIDAARLDVRISERGLPDEIQPLVGAINQALGRLQRAFQAQSDFTADVAHELRTPLAVLRLRVDAIADRKTAAALHADIEVMSRVVEQLLALADLEAEGMEQPVATTDLRAAAERVIRHLAPAAIARRRELALSGADGPNLVRADPGVVFQALRNLVENALAHTPEGSTVEVVLEPGGVAHVLDRGPGVPEAERELIFERFWRRDRRTSGAGLGLAIVARILSACGGSIAVMERPGGGADFVLRLSPVTNPG